MLPGPPVQTDRLNLSSTEHSKCVPAGSFRGGPGGAAMFQATRPDSKDQLLDESLNSQLNRLRSIQ